MQCWFTSFPENTLIFKVFSSKIILRNILRTLCDLSAGTLTLEMSNSKKRGNPNAGLSHNFLVRGQKYGPVGACGCKVIGKPCQAVVHVYPEPPADG